MEDMQTSQKEVKKSPQDIIEKGKANKHQQNINNRKNTSRNEQEKGIKGNAEKGIEDETPQRKELKTSW